MNLSSSALILGDLQNDFLHRDGAYGRAGQSSPAIVALPDRLVPLVKAARKSGILIVATLFTLVPGRTGVPIVSLHLKTLRSFLTTDDFAPGSWGQAAAARFEQLGMDKAAEGYASAPSRVQFQNNDPRGWREFADQLAGNSTRGAALTMRGVQARRPSLFDLVEQMKKITAPTLVVSGDEDWPCLKPGILMKRTIPTAGLVVMPNCGHTMNLEEPAAFNQHVADFLHAVEAGRWPTRDPRAMVSAILGK